MPGGTSASRPPSRLARARRGLRDLFGARELLANLVRRDLKVRHRGTFLGMLWSLATPLMLVALYSFIFKVILRASPAVDAPRPDGNAVPFAVYFFAGLTIWNLFSNSINSAAGSVVSSGYLLRKVYFPKAILPLAAVLSSLVTFAFELGVLAFVTLVFVGWPSLHVLWLPVLVALVLLLAYGLSLFLSALTVFLRDVQHFLAVFMQIWFWGTPIIYSLQFVGDRPGLVRMLKLNPLTGVVVSFRNVVVLNRAPDFLLLGYAVAVAAVFLALGAYVFHRWQRLFSEIV